MENGEKKANEKKSSAPKVLFGIIVVVAFVALLIFFSADSLLKTGIETAIQKQLGLEASLSSAHVSLLSGKIQVNDLKIKNPQGYEQEYLLELKSLQVDSVPSSLFSNTIEISQIKLIEMAVTIEQKGLTSNLNDVLKSMPKSDKPKPDTDTDTDKTSAKKSKNVHVTSLDIENINVKAKVIPLPGKMDTVEIKIEKIHLSDIGGDKKVSAAELIGKIITAVTKEIASKGTDILPAELIGPMDDFLKNADVESVIKAGEDIIKTGEDLGKEVENIAEGLKGIFEKKD